MLVLATPEHVVIILHIIQGQKSIDLPGTAWFRNPAFSSILPRHKKQYRSFQLLVRNGYEWPGSTSGRITSTTVSSLLRSQVTHSKLQQRKAHVGHGQCMLVQQWRNYDVPVVQAVLCERILWRQYMSFCMSHISNTFRSSLSYSLFTSQACMVLPDPSSGEASFLPVWQVVRLLSDIINSLLTVNRPLGCLHGKTSFSKPMDSKYKY